MKRILFLLIAVFGMAGQVFGEVDAITRFKDTTLSYFKPVSGTVIKSDGKNIQLSLNEKDSVRPGMRLKALREGAPFIHPVTKESLGRVEATTGKVEIRAVATDSSSGVVVEGEVKDGDKVRLSDTKVRMFFCQDKSVDWYLGDEYYRKLKASDRFDMIDTALETGDEARVLAEAKKGGADVALILSARQDEKGTVVKARIFWVSDGSKFMDDEMTVSSELTKELKFGEDLFTPRTGEAVMTYNLPTGAKLITTGDFDGDGKLEIVLGTGNSLQVYLPAVDLKPLWELKGTASDDFVWIDAIDLNKNGRDELVVTSLKDSEVVSSLYELTGSEFKKLLHGNYFVRKVGSGLVGQAYSSAEGYAGDVFALTWDGEYKTGDKIKLPKGVNIYDYILIEGAAKEKLVFAYDDAGFMNLYDEKGTRVWRSSASNGGFITTTKKKTTVTYLEGAEWSVKDRLIQRQRDILVVERVPMAEMVKGAGYKSSRIRNYWWNGFSMEDGLLIDGVRGTLYDYAVAGDNLAVLASPFLGIKFENILKGENPLGKVLYIYSVKGR